MLRGHRSLNIDKFLGSETETKALTPSAPTDEAKLIRYRNRYIWLNSFAVTVHLLNVLIISTWYETNLKDIPRNYVFVSPIAQLYRTSHALIIANQDETTCTDVKRSPHFKATTSKLAPFNEQYDLFPPRVAYKNFMNLYNFEGTTVIRYDMPGSELNLDHMMICFCLISFIFQTVHGVILIFLKQDNLPRFIHYLEYAFSSPLMVMVMAVNVGITELFTVTSLGALFCGMNILGMCTEVMVHYAGYIEKEQRRTYELIYILVHLFGWVLFLFAMVPIWLQFIQVVVCSQSNGTPDYGIAAIAVETGLFLLFGLLQSVGLWEKRRALKGTEKLIPAYILFKYDSRHAMLSLFAKTLLAYLLIAPALGVHKDKM
jgi:hypothetical protein